MKPPNKYNKITIIILALFFIAILLQIFTKKFLPTKFDREKQVAIEIQEPDDARSEVSGRWFGLCGKNNINSVEDFYRTVYKDPRLSAHYAGFDWANARIGRLEKPVWAYVYFRSNGTILSPKKQIKLPKGDRYITDGKKWVRAYCCNDFVTAPPAPEKVAPAILRQEVVAGPPAQFSEDPPVQRSAGPSPPVPYVLPIYVATNGHGNGNGHDKIPEPSTLALFGTGIAGLGLAQWLRRRRK